MPPPPPGPLPPLGGQYGGYIGPAHPSNPWQHTPPQPQRPRRGNSWKWTLGAVGLVAVIALTAAVTLSLARKEDGNPSSVSGAPGVSSNASSDIASANDTGPVAVITEDPSCAVQGPVFLTLADEAKKGWNGRDPSVPAAAWVPETRAMFEGYASALSKAADQIVPLAKLTPHRVMRELYEQFIAYSRAYVDGISSYTPHDDYLARVSIAASDALSFICAAIEYGSAAARGPLVPPGKVSGEPSELGDPASPQRFLLQKDAVCADWGSTLDRFQSDTEAWRKTDPDVPGSQWTPEQRRINDEVAPVMIRFADQLRSLGGETTNPTLRDFADLAAQYRQAYATALPTYVPADKYLATASIRLVGVVQGGCQAAAI